MFIVITELNVKRGAIIINTDNIVEIRKEILNKYGVKMTNNREYMLDEQNARIIFDVIGVSL